MSAPARVVGTVIRWGDARIQSGDTFPHRIVHIPIEEQARIQGGGAWGAHAPHFVRQFFVFNILNFHGGEPPDPPLHGHALFRILDPPLRSTIYIIEEHPQHFQILNLHGKSQ